MITGHNPEHSPLQYTCYRNKTITFIEFRQHIANYVIQLSASE